jgi:hypothetical protein
LIANKKDARSSLEKFETCTILFPVLSCKYLSYLCGTQGRAEGTGPLNHFWVLSQNDNLPFFSLIRSFQRPLMSYTRDENGGLGRLV